MPEFICSLVVVGSFVDEVFVFFFHSDTRRLLHWRHTPIFSNGDTRRILLLIRHTDRFVLASLTSIGTKPIPSRLALKPRIVLSSVSRTIPSFVLRSFVNRMNPRSLRFHPSACSRSFFKPFGTEPIASSCNPRCFGLLRARTQRSTIFRSIGTKPIFHDDSCRLMLIDRHRSWLSVTRCHCHLRFQG